MVEWSKWSNIPSLISQRVFPNLERGEGSSPSVSNSFLLRSPFVLRSLPFCRRASPLVECMAALASWTATASVSEYYFASQQNLVTSRLYSTARRDSFRGSSGHGADARVAAKKEQIIVRLRRRPPVCRASAQSESWRSLSHGWRDGTACEMLAHQGPAPLLEQKR